MGEAALRLLPGDLPAWEAAVNRLLDDRQTRARMSEAGRLHAGNLTWEATADRLEGYLRLAVRRAAGWAGTR